VQLDLARMRVTQPPGEAKRFSFERAGTIIGVVSGALGLLVTVIGLPDKLATTFGRSESKAAEIELEQKRAAVRAAAPRLDVMYVFVTTALVQGIEQERAPGRDKADEATTIRSYPMVRNEIFDELNRGDPTSTGCKAKGLDEFSIAFLVVTNGGRRDATDVAVSMRRLRLHGPVLVDERSGGEGAYVAKLNARTRKREGEVVRVPLTLAPGDGVRVPLWISAAGFERHDRWCIVSRTALDPQSLAYVDPVLGSTIRREVRRMVAPTMLAHGVFARG
jgi:hypothetical protein